MMVKHLLHKMISSSVVVSMLFQAFALPFTAPAAATPATSASRMPQATPSELSDGALSIPVAAASTITKPAVLVHPLSISRVQSSYQAGTSVAITYTVTNNRPPTLFPDIPPGATITETIDLTAAFDNGRDPNTLRNVLLTTALTAAATFGAATPVPDRNGTVLAWNLGDIAPLTSKTAVLTLDTPVSAADFTSLDGGATAWGVLQGRSVSASAAPATVVPVNLSQWLIWTVDADIYDEAMLAQAAELGQDPAALFAFVRGLGYEAYDGSLRGTRGTLWSGAGNSADQASLLIAMLRAAGIPARYRHGTLSTGDAQNLIGSMFPEPVRYAGRVLPAAKVSDPVNDPGLLAEAADHWWVEGYLPGLGWRDMDPAFAGAAIGESFATPTADGSDQIAELPDAVRHKIDLRLKVENYHPLNVGNGNLAHTYPFTFTLNAVEVAGQPVSLSHLVQTEGQPGMVFANVIHTYTPYLLIGDREVFGNAYQEIFTTFPLGTLLLTGAWLEFELTAPDGQTQTYEREVKDRIGYENRFNGGTADLAISGDDSALYTDFDILSIGFWPNFVPATAREWAQAAALATVDSVNADSRRLMELSDQESFTPAEEDELRGIRVRYQVNMGRYLSNLTLAFAETAARLARDLEEGSFVKSYYDAPRLIIAGSEMLGDQTGSFSMDLRRTSLRTIAYPGQDTRATVGFNIARGVVESGIEGAVLEASLGAPAATTARLFEAAKEQGIFPVTIDATNLYTLDGLDISEQSKARITAAAVEDGKLIFVHHEPVLLDGEYQSGWWEVDPLTGETIGVMESGLHLATLEYVVNIAVQIISGPLLDFVQGFTAYTWGFVANHVDKAIGPDTFDQATFDSRMGDVSTGLTCMALIAVPSAYGKASCAGGLIGGEIGVPLDFFAFGQRAAQAYLTSRVQGDPPLSNTWLAHRPVAARAAEVSGEIAVTAAFSPGPLSVNVDTGFIIYTGTASTAWAGSGDNGYPFTTLTLSQGDLYDAGGTFIASGPLSASPADDSPATASAAASAAVDGSGRGAYYAPALSGLASSATWSDYTAQLSSGNSYTLALIDAVVNLNGVAYSGDFTVETSDDTFLEGMGAGAAANFAPTMTLANTNTDLIIGPATGTTTAGGSPVDTTNGLAIANSDQTVTLAEADAATDHVELSDTVDFFTLNLAPDNSATDPQTAISFQADIAANFGGTYTLTASGPAGWGLSLGSNGQVTAQPAPGAAAGDYAILVTAQSVAHPDLYLSAVHTVNVAEYDGLQLDVRPDPIFTVPMGPVRNPYTLVSGDTNNGQAQVSGAAYTINITNSANVERTIDLSVSGLPAGWTLLSKEAGVTQTTLALAPGDAGQVGLYVNPDELLPAGTSYDFTVTAVSNTGLAAQDRDNFTMPSVPFSMVVPDPVVVYAGTNTTTTVDLTLTNVGNDGGSFPLSARAIADAVSASSALQSPIPLGPDESHTQPVTLAVGEAPVGQRFPVYFDSPVAGTVYTQTTAVFVQTVTANTHAIFEAADNACTQAQPGLSPALETLALSMTDLESACAAGHCPPVLRDQAVAALSGVATYAGSVFSPLITAADTLQTIADDMAGHTDDGDIEADLEAIGPAVTDLEAQVCEISEHGVALRWSPAYAATLPGEPVTYVLNVENQGTVATTYAITLGLPSGQNAFTDTIPAGSTATYDTTVSEASLDLYELTAAAEATGPGVALAGIGDEAIARLTVVDRFVQVTAVTANPAFVETGTSATTLSVDVTNVANVPRTTTARTEILAPGGAVSYSDELPLTILAGTPRTYELGPVATSGWNQGVYTVTVDLLDDDGDLIPDGYGYGYFAVGQALGAAHSVQPAVVAPGTSTVTTSISTTILAESPAVAAPAAVSLWEPTGRRLPDATAEIAPAVYAGRGSTVAIDGALEIDRPPARTAEADTGGDTEKLTPTLNTVTGTVILRYEEDEAALTGSWLSYNNSQASSGSYLRANAAGETATFTVDGTWAALGFFADRSSGRAEVFIDGASQGVIDLYRREGTAISFVYDGLSNATHTISVNVLGTANANAGNSYVQLDYLDAYDGGSYADGTFEQDDSRIFRSTGWGNANDGAASDGTYIRGGLATAWFPFTGDSVTYQAIAHPGGGRVRVYLDGQYKTTLDLYSPLETVTRRLSFDGLGSGPHVLQVGSYRDDATVDTFSTPGTAPFFIPATPGSFTRFEEDNPTFLFNGVPFTATAQSWVRDDHIFASEASGGQRVYSRTAGDRASFTFEGTWASVGFFTDADSGMAELFVDGVGQGTVDLYSNEDDITSFSYELTPGTHTISLTVLGMGNPLAGNQYVSLDYVDTWDGTALPPGRFEQTASTAAAAGLTWRTWTPAAALTAKRSCRASRPPGSPSPAIP